MKASYTKFLTDPHALALCELNYVDSRSLYRLATYRRTPLPG